MGHQALAPAIDNLVRTLKAGDASSSHHSFMAAMIGVDSALFLGLCLQTAISRSTARTLRALGEPGLLAIAYVIRVSLIPLLAIAVALYGHNLATGRYDHREIDIATVFTIGCGAFLFLRTAIAGWVASATTRREPHLAPELGSAASVVIAFCFVVIGLVRAALEVTVGKPGESDAIVVYVILAIGVLIAFVDPFGWLGRGWSLRAARARIRARARREWHRVVLVLHYETKPIPLPLYLNSDGGQSRWAIDFPDAVRLIRDLNAATIYLEDRDVTIGSRLMIEFPYGLRRRRRLELRVSNEPAKTRVATFVWHFRVWFMFDVGFLCTLNGQEATSNLMEALCDWDPQLREQVEFHVQPATSHGSVADSGSRASVLVRAAVALVAIFGL